MHHPLGIEKVHYSNSNKHIFTTKINVGKYRVVFYYRYIGKTDKVSKIYNFEIIKQNGELKILIEDDKKKLEAERQEAIATPRTPVEANKLLLAQIAERDNYLIKLTSQRETAKVKLESATKTLALKAQQVAKLIQVLKVLNNIVSMQDVSGLSV
ncbi:hypothetical protein [Francisella salimarina]|uniref:hypothetical protein n=1 Tax=Francisella salimarina TaxID=2599927 RepID=UPI003D81A179